MYLDQIKIYILAALASLIALTLHEVSHGYAAYRLGDSTAKNLGRLSINPLKHLDPIGTLCMIFFHFGWAKPVPINPRNFDLEKKNGKRRTMKGCFAITALAGPLTNILLGFLGTGLFLLFYALVRDVRFTSDFLYNLTSNTLIFLQLFYSVNIGLGLFNLIPIPPFDGSRLLNVVLPERAYFKVMKYERQIYLGVLAWLLVGDFVATALRSIPLISATPWLNFAVGIFSLSGMIGTVISFITDLMLKLWMLIPFLRLF